MRSIKLVPALAAAAATSLALAPAGASAARHPGKHPRPAVKHHRNAIRSATCRLRINAAPRFLEAGESALVFGQLLCPSSTSPANQTVTILGSAAGTPGVSTTGTTTTDATGHYQLTTPALLTNSVFYATALGSKSQQRAVKVSPKVTLSGPPDGSQLFTGVGPFLRNHALRTGLRNKVTFTGTVSPVDAGAIVVLQRESAVGGEEWRRIDLSQVSAAGTYSITHPFAVPGDANIRVVVRQRRTNVRGASESLSYEISQAQNPSLTIQSSADPVSYGQPVTISGTIAATPNTPLTLLARTRPQHKFVPVASTTSSGGAYTFAVQTPLQSTFYQVVGGGKSSARMFEGVKYGLTVGASASSVQAGLPVTFSGTVTPGHTGHAVYLQVQSPSGLGFHTVEVGTVSAGSTYSIAHATFNPGAKKFRIKVPGDPENQGVASQLFGVEVTPAPAAALKAEAPGNSSVPSEGHV